MKLKLVQIHWTSAVLLWIWYLAELLLLAVNLKILFPLPRFFVKEHAKNCPHSFGTDLPSNLRTQSIWISAPSGTFFFSFNLAEDGSPCLAREIPAHMSQSYQCMRHYIMTMSQTLTKPAWPRTTTCVTTAGWKYHSTIPLPPLYFGMTKRQFVGRAQNHKASTASHMVGFVLPAPLSPTFFLLPLPRLHLFPLPVSVKSQWSNALT